MSYREIKNTLFKVLAIALSVAALVLCILNSGGSRTVLTIISIALCCKCLTK